MDSKPEAAVVLFSSAIATGITLVGYASAALKRDIYTQDISLRQNTSWIPIEVF
jgi:hypothetical protein